MRAIGKSALLGGGKKVKKSKKKAEKVLTRFMRM
jgi:hypothetical protein